MKVYEGKRTADGLSVMVSGKPLIHHELHSPDGFEWGYGGSGPCELARCILWDYYGRVPDGDLVNSFKWAFVAAWPREGWRITGEQIGYWLREQRSGDRSKWATSSKSGGPY